MEKREGKVKDLVEKLQAGELTPKEAKRGMKKRGLSEQESWKWGLSGFIVWATYFILWLPLNLKFSAQLPIIHFPGIVIYVSLVLLAIGTFFALWLDYSHRKKGGLKESGETIIFYRDGPLRIMRHPGGFGFIIWFIFLPITLSAYVPFTFLSVAAITIIVVFHYYAILVEERFNIRKWGNQYQQYMKEVPRFNFIRGLWNLGKRGDANTR